MPDSTSTPRFARARRRLRKFCIGVAFVTAAYILAGAVFRVLIWAEISKIKREGGPVSIAQLAGPMPLASQNGALVYQKAFALMYDAEGKFKFDALHRLQYDLEYGRGAKTEYWEAARAEFAGLAPVAALARKAASMPRCKFEADWEHGCFPHNTHVIRLADVLRASALVQAHNGDQDEAFETLKLGLRVADSLEEDTILLDLLLRLGTYSRSGDIAAGIAASSDVNAEQARSFCDALDWRRFEDAIPVTWRSERASVLHQFDRAARYGPPKPPCEDTPVSPLMQFECTWAGKPLFWVDEYFQLRAMRHMMESVNTPFRKLPEPKPYPAHCPHRYCNPASPLAFSQEMVVDIDLYSLRRAFDTSRAKINGARLAIATSIYKQRYGQYPGRLADLRRLGWKLDVTDPFTGRDFVYKRNGEGFVLYSVGPDLRDDRGRVVSEGVADDGDIVWRTRR